ncbi:hypothetical protein HYFRA_00004758 [Hymenoscyphus fraxineus]|uniref:Uncharacterized protein n=1 Tax=Hymenoscyphus fraxineus TaxID=746836 RepID=A0A9N9KLG2_9HELO|nr:hypothetical protein HYFRA_00004758 [Hymenoscyphus fraxineus]
MPDQTIPALQRGREVDAVEHVQDNSTPISPDDTTISQNQHSSTPSGNSQAQLSGKHASSRTNTNKLFQWTSQSVQNPTSLISPGNTSSEAQRSGKHAFWRGNEDEAFGWAR